jgi:DNA-binding transcriptional regulator/RsmH inhibitor MraZ
MTSKIGARSHDAGGEAIVGLDDALYHPPSVRPQTVNIERRRDPYLCRFTIPKRFRDFFGERPSELWAICGPASQLYLISERQWNEVVQRMVRDLSGAERHEAIEELERSSPRLHVDANWKINIPESESKHARLDTEVQLFVVAGVVELWAPKVHQQHHDYIAKLLRDNRGVQSCPTVSQSTSPSVPSTPLSPNREPT